MYYASHNCLPEQRLHFRGPEVGRVDFNEVPSVLVRADLQLQRWLSHTFTPDSKQMEALKPIIDQATHITDHAVAVRVYA